MHNSEREVIVTRTSGGRSEKASGYWLGGDLIITCRIGFRPEGSNELTLGVQFIGSSKLLASEPAWQGGSGGDEVSLVRITDADWAPPGAMSPPGLGRVSGGREIDCTIVGFVPSYLSLEVDSEVIRGKIDPRLRRQADAVMVIPEDPEPIKRNGILWNSLQGAGLVCGDTFVGVVTQWELQGQCRISAVPISRLLSDRNFESFLHAALDAKPALKPVQADAVRSITPPQRTESLALPAEGEALPAPVQVEPALDPVSPLSVTVHVSEPGELRAEALQGVRGTSGKKTQTERIFYKLSTWIIFGIIAGLLPLLRGSGLSFDEAVEKGELYFTGAVISLAALGDMFYSVLPMRDGRKLVLFKREVFSPLFFYSVAISIGFILLNVVNALNMPQVDESALQHGLHPSFARYYVLFATTVIASASVVLLGAAVDD